ncbi:MAG TPA: TonB-dependent receptor [Prolixibacteraceae bacterium]|nr:TonB-dependent receptor [Prolixibacteraceae bacterium]
MLKCVLIGCCFFLVSIAVFSQTEKIISGKVVNKKTDEAVGFAAVHIVESDLWTTTDLSGSFNIRPLHNEIITLEISCLGFEPIREKFQASDFYNSGIHVKMVPISYDMEEITVLAKNNNDLVSSSLIGNAAVELVQPVSLADLMQLIPGNISVNPDLSKVQKISLREVNVDDNSAMGTAVLVDGAPISNNANLQNYSTSKSDNNFITSVGSGVDLRQFSTDNIESVEVVKGIPSVVYGDLTSGAILVKTKAGYTPWEVKLKTDALIKQVSFGKGFDLKKKNSINFNLDYLQAFDDLRSKYNGFNRINADVGYSKIFSLKKSLLSFNTKISGYGTIDDSKTDPDAMVKGEQIKSKNKGVRLNIFGKWSTKSMLLSNLDYSFSLSYAHQTSSEEKYRSTGGVQMISTSLTEGENDGIYLPSEQFASYVIDGKPLNMFFQLTGSRTFNFKREVNNKVLYGCDFRLDANYGSGQLYDVSNPLFVSSYSQRPRSFKDIPALQNSSIYLEDKLSALLGKTILDLQGGLRLNNFQTSGLLKSDLGFYLEPRLNAQYSFLTKQNNNYFDKMAIRIGIGKTVKAPPLIYLYPDKAYFDFIALNYYVGNPAYNTALISTKIFDTANPDLKPSKNLKLEAGLIFKINRVNATVTAFREKLTDGFEFASNYMFVNYNRYLAVNVPAGTKPDVSRLSKISVSQPVAYQMPVNNQETQKTGIEYAVELGKIKPVYTSITVDGAWLRTKHVYSTIPVQYQPESTTSTPYGYVGIYPSGESKISERLNTNCRMVTQIPRLRMIVTTTVQMIWYDTYYYPKYDETPLFLRYADGTIQNFTTEMSTNSSYDRFVIAKSGNYYNREKMPFLPQVNFKLSKEIYEKIKLSFYVNNLVNYRPEYELKRSNSFIRRNSSIYFGAELKILI